MRKWQAAYKLNDSLRKEIFDKVLPHMANLLVASIREGESDDEGEGDDGGKGEAAGGLLLQGKHKER